MEERLGRITLRRAAAALSELEHRRDSGVRKQQRASLADATAFEHLVEAK
jgi:hypothetical protein